jgi:hypothetical protein
MRENIEIELKEGIDAFKIEQQLNTFVNIKCAVVDCSKIRVWFNPDKIAAKKILKVVAAITNQDHRKRKRNVNSVRPGSGPCRTNVNSNGEY